MHRNHMHCCDNCFRQVATAGEAQPTPASPGWSVSDASSAAPAASSPQSSDAALAKMKAVAKKQKEKIAAQKQEIAQLQSKVCRDFSL